jgi:hypothetical protein
MFLNSCPTGGFTRRTKLHAVSKLGKVLLFPYFQYLDVQTPVVILPLAVANRGNFEKTDSVATELED